jgi:hypothetical protein
LVSILGWFLFSYFIERVFESNLYLFSQELTVHCLAFDFTFRLSLSCPSTPYNRRCHILRCDWSVLPLAYHFHFPFCELRCMLVCFHNLVTCAQRLQDLYTACLMFWMCTHTEPQESWRAKWEMSEAFVMFVMQNEGQIKLWGWK